MKDHLLDLVSHTFDLGCIDLVKIVGDNEKTTVCGIAANTSVVLLGEFHAPVADFVGKFGMPNLGKLKVILNLDEYKENAKLSITRNEDKTPNGIDFVNSNGDFRNNYRFMTTNIIETVLETPEFVGAKWGIEFTPTVASIMRLKMQAQANAEETLFQAKTEDGHLKFFFGDHSTHAGNFVFQHDVNGTLTRTWSWPISELQRILSLSGDKVFRISDSGAIMISVDSGMAKYDYILPAQQK